MKIHRLASIPALSVILFLLGGCTSPESFDIVLRGGMVIDGTGAAAFAADVGIRDGSIADIGRLRSVRAEREIDIRGFYVTPGFIDIHTHCENLRRDERKAALNYLTQGVTTVVTGNCGSGTHRVADYFETLERQGIGVNVVHLVGHASVRSAVMGNAGRAPKEEEMQAMLDLVVGAMEEGAVGLSTGLFYAPGSFAAAEEIIRLLDPVGRHGGIYASHIRDESDYTIGLLASIQEAIEIGEKAGVPVQISHIKALGRAVWGSAPAVCDLIESARARGVAVTADQYPYRASSTSLTAAVVPRDLQADGKLQENLSDLQQLPAIRPRIAENIARRGGAETLVIASFPERPDWTGKSLREISGILGKSETDTAIELVLQGGPAIVSFNMTEEDVEFFMQKPYIMTGSDGSAQEIGKAQPHPRNYGAFTRKLRTYVFDRKLMGVESAVRAASGLPAEVLRLSGRGTLQKGGTADVVVFDPQIVRDRATFERPHQYSEGISYVIIAGEIVIDAGEYTGVLKGKPIRSQKNSP